MKLISDVFSAIQSIFIWGTLLVAVIVFLNSVSLIAQKTKSIKLWLMTIFSMAYIITFFIVRAIDKDLFDNVGGILFLIAAIISTQFAKYEDRKSGKRWWTR
jgi:hypothetical protein